MRGSATMVAVITLLACGVTWAEEPKTKEIAYDTYQSQGDRVTFVVGTYLAGLERAESVIPFRVAVGVRGKGPELGITPANFVLYDADGDSYGPTTPQQMADHQSLIMWVHDVTRSPLELGKEFENSHRVASNMYDSEAVAWDEVHLDRDTYLSDVIYFPAPKSGLDGTLKMRFESRGMMGPVDVEFEIKRHGKKKKG